jgi:hypothetical protein
MEETKPRTSLIGRVMDKITEIISTEACPKVNLNNYHCALKPGYRCHLPEGFNECPEYQRHLIEGYST